MMLAYEVRVQRRDSELSFEGIASCTAPIMLIHSIQEKLRSEDHTSRKSLKKCHLIVGQAFWRERTQKQTDRSRFDYWEKRHCFASLSPYFRHFDFNRLDSPFQASVIICYIFIGWKGLLTLKAILVIFLLLEHICFSLLVKLLTY